MKQCITRIKPLQFLLLLLAPLSAFAHPGIHHPHDWLDGAIHLLTEVDHFAVIIAAVALILYIRSMRRKKSEQPPHLATDIEACSRKRGK